MMLDGKKIIVTGAASGIGRATAILAAREGADVAVADIDRAGAEETAALVQAEGRETIVIEMDTSKAADAQRMADETVAAFGTIDGIVCGAIKLQPSKLEELTEEAWDMVIDVGLKGYFLCAQDTACLSADIFYARAGPAWGTGPMLARMEDTAERSSTVAPGRILGYSKSSASSS